MVNQFKTLLLTLSLFIGTASLYADARQYLEDFTAGRFKPQQMAESHSMADGERYTMLSDDRKQIIAYNYKTGRATDTIFDVETAKGCDFQTVEGYEFDESEQRLLIHSTVTPIYRRTFTTKYYLYDIARRVVEPLSSLTDVQQAASFSPNGRLVAFASGNNLYLKKIDFNTEIAITNDGAANSIINGTPDWVYEEEFMLNRCFEFSADSKLLAWIRFDESAIKQFSFDQYHHPYDSAYTYKYPKAGESNSSVSVHVYDIQNRTTKQMDCGTGNEIYFPILRATNDDNFFALVRLNRNQTRLDLLRINARSGVSTTILTEQDKVYIDYQNYTGLRFLSDGSFHCLSERDGYRHIYHYDLNGKILKQVTSGTFDVTEFYGYDEQTRTLYFQAAKEHPTQRHIYKADRKGKITNLDARPGIHSAQFSRGMRYIITQFNNTTTANTYTLCNSDGRALRTILDNNAAQELFNSYNLPEKEFFSFTTEAGVKLDGWMVRPADFDPSREYPLVMTQYSGPDSQEALNRFRPDWEYYLAQRGYIVACVDSRGTAAKGHEFRTCTYWQLGLYEAEDQIAAAKYLGSQSYIDASRIAIWGWSYGGFMVLNCMTNGSGVFKAGIATAPVTDWRLYNTAYTERFMSTPQENYKGYDQSDLIKRASQLRGRLLLCHGTADDNVHIQHSMLFIEQLVEAGKQFEMQFYPNKNHSILGAKTRLHLYTRFTDFLDKNL